MNQSNLYFYKSFELKYHGSSALLGISPDGTAYVEEMYDDDTWLARYMISPHNELTTVGDENYGAANLAFFELPPGSTVPNGGHLTNTLNFSGPRQRGLLEEERIRDVARPLTMQAKIQITQQLNLSIAAPMILGITESYVISEARLNSSLFVVCRRIQIAYALMSMQSDPNGNIYNYDSLRLNVAHLYSLDMENEVPVDVALQGLPGHYLNNPLDCLIHKDQLWIADGGTSQAKSAIRVWEIVR